MLKISALTVAAVGCLALPAQADTWPAKPIKAVVPFGAGETLGWTLRA